MSIISQETWDNMPEKEKEEIRELWNTNEKFCKAEYNIDLEALFGKENLQPKPKIRTWEDVAIYNPELWDFINKLGMEIANCPYIDSKLYKKLIATIHIQKLIELGYGGMVTEEEWENDNIRKYCVVIDNGKIAKAFNVLTIKQFIAFHTPEQLEKFMSYPENVELVKQYHLL